jgi:hypothetical protein
MRGVTRWLALQYWSAIRFMSKLILANVEGGIKQKTWIRNGCSEGGCHNKIGIDTSDSSVRSITSPLVSKEVRRWIPHLEAGFVRCRYALGGGRYTPGLILRSFTFLILSDLGKRNLHFLHLNPWPLPIDSHRAPQLEQGGFSHRTS